MEDCFQIFPKTQMKRIADHQEEKSGHIVPGNSLPDYLLLTTVLTQDYPVPAIATSVRQEEGQGWNIPVRRGEGQQPVG